MTNRPLPKPDPLSTPFWEAAAVHDLKLARCNRCSTISHPPDVVCQHCHHSDPRFTFESVSGAGSVRSWVVIRQSFVPGFEADVPFVLVDVALDVDPDIRLIGRLLDGPDVPVALGDLVRLDFEDLAPGFAVPAFRLDPLR